MSGAVSVKSHTQPCGVADGVFPCGGFDYTCYDGTGSPSKIPPGLGAIAGPCLATALYLLVWQPRRRSGLGCGAAMRGQVVA